MSSRDLLRLVLRCTLTKVLALGFELRTEGKETQHEHEMGLAADIIPSLFSPLVRDGGTFKTKIFGL